MSDTRKKSQSITFQTADREQTQHGKSERSSSNVRKNERRAEEAIKKLRQQPPGEFTVTVDNEVGMWMSSLLDNNWHEMGISKVRKKGKKSMN